MNAIKKLDEWLSRIESGTLVVLVFLMVFLAFGQIVLRNLFSSGLLWTDLLMRQLVLWVGFLGASLAVREGRHISIDVLPQMLPTQFRPWLKVLVHFTAGVVTVFLTVAAWNFVRMEIEFSTTVFLNIPAWIFQTVLPYSFAMISLRYFLIALDASVELWKKP